MKKLMVLAMMGWVTLPACATYYEITSGYMGALTLQNDDSLLMTGGGQFA